MARLLKRSLRCGARVYITGSPSSFPYSKYLRNFLRTSVKNPRILLISPVGSDMSSSREELNQLAKTLTHETDKEKLLQIAERMLDTLDRLEADKGNNAGGVITMQRRSS